MARSANPQSRALWQTRLRQFTASKLTVHEFCASVGCSAPTYYYWKRKFACPEPVFARPDDGIDGFIPVTVQRATASRIHVQLPGGTRLSLPASDTDMRCSFDGLYGIAIWMKRLERGSLQHPQPSSDTKHLVMDTTQLQLLLTGFELSSVQRRKRYVAPEIFKAQS